MNTQPDRELEETYGPAAQFSEHKRGQRVTYQVDSFTYSGEILWVQQAGEAAGHDLPLRYVVAPDPPRDFVDIVFPSDVLEN